MSQRLGHRWLRLISLLVPSVDRRLWLEEWNSELWHLHHRPGAAIGGPRRFADTLALCVGAIPHSLWERKEWTLAVLMQDVRFAVRTLTRTPGFAALAIITMALGIGANTSIFSLVNGVLLRAPAGIDAPETLVQIGRGDSFDNFAYPYLELFRDSAETLESVAVYGPRQLVVGQGDDARLVSSHLVSGDYFALLRVDAVLGRTLTRDDNRTPGGHPVAVISTSLWNDRYGRDPEILDHELRINGQVYRVVGVAEPGFRGTEVIRSKTDLWLPMMMAGEALGGFYREFNRPGFSWLWMLGRPRADVSVAAVREELDTLYRAFFEDNFGQPSRSGVQVVSGIGLRPDDRATVRTLMMTLLAIAAAVLLIACANLAGLLLARGLSRGRELGVRAALGAGRLRLMRQLLTESVLLALTGGAVAMVLTFWTARAMPALLPTSLGVDLAPDLRVLAFGLAVSLATGLLFGLVPAIKASRHDLVGALKEGGAQASHRASWLRRGLVVAQLGLSFALVAATALLVQSMRNAQTADPGFNTEDVLTLTYNLDRVGYEAESGRVFHRTLLERASGVPGISSAALGSAVPFNGWSRITVYHPEPQAQQEDNRVNIDTAWVTPEWFATLGIAPLRGEPFAAHNSGADMPQTVVINEAAARLFWPGEEAVGKLLPLDADRALETSARVLAVVPDIHNRSLRRTPAPAMYLAAAGRYQGRMTLFVRTAGDPALAAAPLRALLAELEPDLAVSGTATLHEYMSSSLTDTLMVARLAGLLGLLAAVLAAVGLYGVVAHMAARRTHEVGVRMALGARAGHVLRLVAREGAWIAVLGVGVGVVIALPAGSLLASLLYGVSPREPSTLIATALAMGLLALLAALIPARRAARVDPVIALRED